MVVLGFPHASGILSFVVRLQGEYFSFDRISTQLCEMDAAGVRNAATNDNDRALRILKIFRILRIVRILKLAKFAL